MMNKNSATARTLFPEVEKILQGMHMSVQSHTQLRTEMKKVPIRRENCVAAGMCVCRPDTLPLRSFLRAFENTWHRSSQPTALPAHDWALAKLLQFLSGRHRAVRGRRRAQRALTMLLRPWPSRQWSSPTLPITASAHGHPGCKMPHICSFR